MGIAVGYFAPADDTKMAALRRNSKASHDMPNVARPLRGRECGLRN